MPKKNPYVKLSLILPKNKSIKSIKTFDILGKFEAKKIELFVRPSNNEKYHIVDVYLIQ